MPALRAAAGSFQVKSPTTYLITVLMTVRALPFVLTVVLIFSVILFVSILGARSYSDQRYSSMQISATRHSSGISIGRATGFGSSFTFLSVDRDTSRPRASGCGVGRDSGKGTSRADASAAEKPARTEEFSGGSGSATAVLPSVTAGLGGLRWDAAAAATELITITDGVSTTPGASPLKSVAPRVASRPPLALFSMPDEPMTPNLAALHPVSAIMPHNNATKETRFRGVIGPSPALPRKVRRTAENTNRVVFRVIPGFVQMESAADNHFSETCCPNAARVSRVPLARKFIELFCALCQASWQLADVPPAHSDVGLCGVWRADRTAQSIPEPDRDATDRLQGEIHAGVV